MGSEAETLEERLTSLYGQLQAECGILERMVRRDLRLLQSSKLEDTLNSCFQVITGKKPKQKAHLLESLKRKKCEGEKHNFMERLLGAARLLSQMVEPMLKASTEISTLLAQSFFMGFSLTILALLARLRVLVQQILLDVVSVFNMVSSLTQKKQSVKITQEGLEVFREFFPTKDEFVTLECAWESDKFVLLEIKHKSEISSHDGDLEGNESLQATSVQYQRLESFLRDELHSKSMDEDHAAAAETGLTHTGEDKTDLCPSPSIGNDVRKVVEGSLKVGDAPSIAETPASKKFTHDGLPGSSSSSSSFLSSNTSKLQSGSRRVAFVSVKNPLTSTSSLRGIQFKETESKSNSKEDSFFSLLTAGNTKDSVF
ncbi:hypothetical protein FNV43_RR03940 [Rhamnella rubrinervis]|uniref:Nucleolus and neural progenitor protein-like N-terminal domain-containing protein n=1 Tax=Rhamnella rubrinervis TaxID=2594499 RepID=A0A8K0MQ42_9ROSA|nr:hypothetical protein FNV43_RR03940 [Rhamnella rubrinervis]